MKHKLAMLLDRLNAAQMETPWNVLHRMDGSNEALQVKMIVTLERMKFTPMQKMVIITFLNARLNQYDVYLNIKPVPRARIIERMLFAQNQFSVSLGIVVDE